MAYNVGPNGGRSRERYAQFLPNIEPYNFIEDVVEAQTAIEQAESEADAARLRIRHHNRLRITDDLTNLPSVIAVAEGLPMGPDEAESQDDYMDDANDKVLLHASEVMQEVIDNGTFYHDTDQPLRRSEVLDAIQGLHARGHAGPAVELQTALAKSDWGDDMSMGVRIESSPEDVQTLEIQYTGLENDYSEPDEYTAWRRAQQSPDQGRRGIEALKLSTNSGLPLGISADGMSYDHQSAMDAQALINSLRMDTGYSDDDGDDD